ncbi:hypothetical protein EG329_013507 [Mollisiaceae sp. DMI_Dod_QoI]|nr:hypothetical protein EG329_013507 [Helotiales sp. DMI_Dod_QoI]
MDTGNSTSSKRINVLALDGGGVRGLSTLLILQSLMEHINLSIESRRGPNIEPEVVKPHDIFDLVAGTSTGGLIAVMLGKLGMTVEQCIDAYRRLSATIFGKKHLRARVTGGLAPAKYSGSKLRGLVRGLMHEHRSNEDLSMSEEENRDVIACALICREHQERSRYSDFKTEAVCICSRRPCPNPLNCLVCDGARATSAAPTFFPVQEIDGRYFADGGMEFNNPSHEIFHHYGIKNRVAEAHRTSVATETDGLTGFHSNPDFSDVRIINLGTGTEPNIAQLRNQNNFAFLVPGVLRMFLFLKSNLTKIATNSERVAASMKTLAYISRTGNSSRIKYERFSADNGVCFIKMDKYKKLAEIERLTLEYLDTDAVKQALSQVAGEIAQDYLASHSTETTAANQLALPVQRTERPQMPVSEPTPTSPQSSETPSSTTRSTDHSEAGADNTPSRYSASTTPSSIEPGPSWKTSNVAESMPEMCVGRTSPVLPSRSINIIT